MRVAHEIGRGFLGSNGRGILLLQYPKGGIERISRSQIRESLVNILLSKTSRWIL